MLESHIWHFGIIVKGIRSCPIVAHTMCAHITKRSFYQVKTHSSVGATANVMALGAVVDGQPLAWINGQWYMWNNGQWQVSVAGGSRVAGMS